LPERAEKVNRNELGGEGGKERVSKCVAWLSKKMLKELENNWAVEEGPSKDFR